MFLGFLGLRAQAVKRNPVMKTLLYPSVCLSADSISYWSDRRPSGLPGLRLDAREGTGWCFSE